MATAKSTTPVYDGLEEQRSRGTGKVGPAREIPVWEADDAPAGSTAESLLEYENGKPARVAGPTHHVHLQNGRVVSHFGGGTHYSEVDEDGNDVVHKIIVAYDNS
jgi:hypothetical protein